jgi:Domain of unknown function (DUF4411)
MKEDAPLVLDANAFIQAHRRFYAFDFCPGYWQALKWHHKHSGVCSVDRVREELERGEDKLFNWVKANLPKTFFASTADLEIVSWYRKLAEWIQAEPQFLPRAAEEFASAADGWLVAFAKARGGIVVTLEEFDPLIKKRVPIPNLCKAFDVEYITPFEMLARLDVKLTWKPPR